MKKCVHKGRLFGVISKLSWMNCDPWKRISELIEYRNHVAVMCVSEIGAWRHNGCGIRVGRAFGNVWILDICPDWACGYFDLIAHVWRLKCEKNCTSDANTSMQRPLRGLTMFSASRTAKMVVSVMEGDPSAMLAMWIWPMNSTRYLPDGVRAFDGILFISSFLPPLCRRTNVWCARHRWRSVRV